MAQFKLTESKEFSSPYSVIMELEKLWPITAKPAGNSYIITTDNQEIIASLRTMTTLNDKTVRFQELLPEQRPCVYIVMGVPTDVPIETIKLRIPGARKAERQTKFDRQRRLPHDTPSVKIWATGEIPPTVELGALGTRKMRIYVPDPLRCYQCQQYGHQQTACRNTTKCSFCSQNHPTKDCPDKETERKCVNCKGKHSANSNACPIWKQKARETRNRFLATLEAKKQDKPPTPTAPANTPDNYPSMTNKAPSTPARTTFRPTPKPRPATRKTAPNNQVFTMTKPQLKGMMQSLLSMWGTISGTTFDLELVKGQIDLLVDTLVPAAAANTETVWATTTEKQAAPKAGTPADNNINDMKEYMGSKKRPLNSPLAATPDKENKRKTLDKDLPAHTAMSQLDELETEQEETEQEEQTRKMTTPSGGHLTKETSPQIEEETSLQMEEETSPPWRRPTPKPSPQHPTTTTTEPYC